MSNEIINFSPDLHEFDSGLVLGVTKRAVEQMRENRLNLNEVLTKITAKNNYILLSTKDPDKWRFIVDNWCFTIAIVQEKSFPMISFGLVDLITQNFALCKGLNVSFKHGVKATHIDTSSNSKVIYHNGNKLLVDKVFDYKGLTVSDDQTIRRLLAQQDTKIENEVEVVNVEEQLDDYLSLADNYAILDNEMENQKAIIAGVMHYSKLESIEYERVDRPVYRFTFENIETNDILVEGSSLVIMNKEEKEVNGEIVKAVRQDSQVVVDLMFLFQISIDEFPPRGEAKLFASNVVLQVQQDAIEKIRNNEAAAKYFNNILGKYQPEGFDEVDFSKLDATLKTYKFPPNPSQMDAIHKGIASKDVFLVMGPPGTGKTTVILEWVKYFVKEKNMRVLVSSQNNKAVDNVLARIAEEEDINVLRLGSEAKVQGDVQPFIFENKLRNIRKNITKGSHKSTNRLAMVNEYLDKCFPKLNSYKILYDDYVKSFDALQKDIKVCLYDQYQQMLKNKTDAKNTVKLINDLTEQNKVLQDKIAQNEQSALSFLYIISNMISKKTIAKNIDLLDKYHKDLLDLKQEYTYAYEQYTNAYARLEREYQHLSKTLNVDIKKAWNELYPIINFVNSKFKMFEEELQPYHYSQTNVINQLYEIITRTKTSLKDIIDVLGEWKDSVENTQNYALSNLVLSSVNLVGATCIGVNSQKRFSDLKFDVTIIDEAGQIQIQNAIVPMSVSNKLIMLGDHKQIPPSVDQELVEQCEANNVSPNLLFKSLFEDMYNRLPASNKTMLDTQFRMPNEISDLLSDFFYEGNYKAGPNKINLDSVLPSISSKPAMLIDTSKVKGRMETKVPEKGCYNVLEAKIIKCLVKEIEKVTDDLSEVGVISAYKLQVEKIKKEIKPIVSAAFANEMVASLDSFQGQERDIIIYSFTKSNNIPPEKKRIGFLKELRRLNVAMSRCKKMLILIGDFTFLSECSCDEKEPTDAFSEKDFATFVKELLNRVKNQGKGEYLELKQFEERLDVKVNDD